MHRLPKLAYLLVWLMLLHGGSAMAQTPTPTTQNSPPLWWQLPQEQTPFVLLLLVGLAAFILGKLFSPVLDAVGNAFKYWVQGWGKQGDFRQRYLSHVIQKSHYLSMLTPNIVAARREYHQTVAALEDLFTPLEVGPARDGGMGEGGEEITFERATRTRHATRTGRYRGAPRNRIQALWWRLADWLRDLWHRIRPPWEPSAAAIGELIQATPRLVVRGHPGSGKTTVLRYLALSCARSLRGNAAKGDDPKATLRRFGWKRAPFPIFVPLNLLADVGKWPEDRRLVEEIVATLPVDLQSSYPPGFLEKELRRGNCLVLFDGFDELGSPSARGKMARLIGDMADAYNLPQNRFLVSTRIVGYEGQLNSNGFQIHNVQELDDDAVRELVNRRYRAAALHAGYGRSEEEKKILLEEHNQKAADLLSKLRRNEGLQTLTANPLLLSLITLVHMAQIGLPEQRHLLYRDCVEILTERWQMRKRAEAGMETARLPDELSLEQKITLLQEIALIMQQRRDGSESQAVIPRDEVRAHIASRLPDFVAAWLPEEAQARSQECTRRADALLENIREESGILIEKGLDAAGEPIIGFSHLTFQEYLAADALRERPHERRVFYANLFNPTWRETLLLYVAMVDARDVVQRALADDEQMPLRRHLLAGRCLSEKVTIDAGLRARVLAGLRGWLRPPGSGDSQSIDDLLARFGDEGLYEWLLDSLADLLTPEERAGLAGPDGANAAHRHSRLQQALLRLLGSDPPAADRYAAGCALSAIGDPRDLDEMVTVHAGEFLMGSNDEDKLADADEKPQHRLSLDAFRIGAYPVTNGQYARFVGAANHPPPPHWSGETPPPWLENHPVVNVTWHDARAYCRWRSESDGIAYRLPSEAEWEKAARGDDGRIYPWGNDWDPSRCNSSEGRGDWTTTPVGMYLGGGSPYSSQDMAGNVWEWTLSAWHRGQQNSEYAYPYNPKDGRERTDTPDTWGRVLRGGSFGYDRYFVRCAARFWNLPGSGFRLGGFRLLSPGG